MAQAKRWRMQKRRSHLCSAPIDTARLLPPAPASSMSPTPLANPNPPLFGDFLRAAPIVGHEPAQLQSTPISDGSGFISTADSRALLAHKREQSWVSDMDEYLAASRLCREEAMACALLTATVHWPFVERESRKKKKKHRSLVLTCRALNAGTEQSWRGLKKLFSKQFMPFSNRDHHGLHHINTTISKRSLKTLNVGSRKMDSRIQVGVSKCDFVLGCKELQGKENVEEGGNKMREHSSIETEICQSRLRSCEKNCKLQQAKLKKGGIKSKVHILLNKASSIALDVCDILNLE